MYEGDDKLEELPEDDIIDEVEEEKFWKVYNDCNRCGDSPCSCNKTERN